MLKQRLLTVLIVLPLFVAAFFLLPNLAWSALILVPLSIAAHEWSRLARFNRNVEVLFISVLVIACAVLLWHAQTAPSGVARGDGVPERTVLALSLAFWCVIAPSWLWLKPTHLPRPLLLVTGLLLLMPAWVALVLLQRTPWFLLAVLAVVWIADSAAYFAGRTWGRHKLAPSISPGKTWEGVAGAVVAVIVYAYFVYLAALGAWSFSVIAAIFLGMTALSIVGDLLESWFKRRAGVKDSGTIFPGHGGMLDRIDGVIAALPLAGIALI